ncbi:MAG TPA: hypothetical protein VM099_05930 [Gemmatimonadaceae bacterium]|nr:hypothetical protein [Gemmatimonadaceae bacterium]
MRQVSDSYQRDCWPTEVRNTVALISAALMMVLAACSDSADKMMAPSSGVRASTGYVSSSGHGSGYAGQVKLCVDAASPAGTYKFRNSSWNVNKAIAAGSWAGVSWSAGGYDPGDGGEGWGAAAGSTSWQPAKYDGSEYTVAVGSCITVINRTQPSDHYSNDMIDDFQSVNMTATAWPATAGLDHVDCVGDQGVVAPQPTPCGSASNPTRAFANYDHGTQVTFVFKTLPPPPSDCVLGYPDNSALPRSNAAFNESEVLRAFGRGAGQIRMWYNDENAMTLGVRQLFVDNKTGADVTANYGIATMVGNPANATGAPVAYGSVLTSGEGAAVDGAGRPLFPALFVTDLTASGATSRAGDWQRGGTALAPNGVYGTWKGAVMKVDKTRNPAVTTITPDANPSVKNHTNVGPGGINLPAGVADEGYSTEVVWNIANIPGYDPTHTYRLQFMVHDGDQNKTGGDVGQACFNIGPGTPENFTKIAN